MIRNTIAAVVFAVGAVGPLAYLLADRTLPYEYLSGEVLPPDPEIGHQISIHWHVRVNRFCPGWVQRDIIDRRGYVWHNVGGPVRDITPVTPGSETHIVNTIELPRQLGVGPAEYQAHVTFKCNPLQRLFWPIHVSLPRLPFVIR